MALYTARMPCLHEALFLSSPFTAITIVPCGDLLLFFFSFAVLVDKMDTHVADDKLKELHVEDTTVKANRDALQYEIDPAAEKKLLRKIDLHVVPILWFLFMYVSGVASVACL